MADKETRKRAVITAVIVHAYLAVHFGLGSETLVIPGAAPWQFPVLLGGLSAISVVFYLSGDPSVTLSLLIAKLGLLGISSYMHVYSLSIDLAILCVILFESIMFLRPPVNHLIAGVLTITFLLHRFVLNPQYRGPRALIAHDLVISGLLILGACCLATYLKRLYAFLRAQEEELLRLEETVNRLTLANIGLQQYSRKIESESADEERKRITREIHDTTGYAFVNINMLIEGAMASDGDHIDETRRLLTRAQEQAQEGLLETRMALRNLRKIDATITRGPAAVSRLVRTFQEATGVAVSIDYREPAGMWDTSFDETIYSFVQQGLTNSFGHGKAGHIGITFREADGKLVVKIRDDGGGSQSIVEGIGLTGMKERAAHFGGAIEAVNVYEGFEVSMTLPTNQYRAEPGSEVV